MRWREQWRATSGRGRKVRGLLELVRPYRGRTILMFLSLLLSIAATLAPPVFAKLAIDEGIVPGDISKLNLYVAAFLVTALVYWGASAAQTYLVSWIGQRVLQDLRLRLFSHIQSLSLNFYSSRPTGVILSRLTNDIQALDQLVTDGLVTVFGATLTLIGTAVILIYLDAQLALITFLIFPLLGIASLIFRVVSADAYRATREKLAALTVVLQETLSGIRVVRAFAREGYHTDQFIDRNADNRDTNMRTVYLNAAYFPGVEFLSALLTAGILLFGGYQAIEGNITIGVLVAFIAALNNFFDPIQSLSQFYTTYQAGMAALDKVFELLDEKPDLADKADAVSLKSVRGEIIFEDVSFSYKGASDRYALSDISLNIAAGERVALVGATGAGKSTFAKLIARFHDPTTGRVLLDGHDLRDLSTDSIRDGMGIVPQDAFLFSGTISENIGFGKVSATEDEIRSAAELVGADEFISLLPDGYDTLIGERGVKLSAGQKQLVAFARALIRNPQIVILDEASSHIDLRTEAKLLAAIETLLAGRTAVIIAHRLSTIKDADRIVVLEHGRIVEQGTHSELLAVQGFYWRMYRDWALQAEASEPG